MAYWFQNFEYPLYIDTPIYILISILQVFYVWFEAPIGYISITANFTSVIARRVAEIQIFENTYLIVIKDGTGLKFKINDSTLFLIGSYAQNLVASY